MVELKKDWQAQTKGYKDLGVILPSIQIQKGFKTPNWIHFGGGNLYRGMHAEIAQDLIDVGELDTGIVVLETFDDETISKGYHAFNNQILQVVMKENGNFGKRLLSSTMEAYYSTPKNHQVWQQINEYFKGPELQFITLTITEKGYNLVTSKDEYLPVIKKDMEEGPDSPNHTISIITSLLYTRFKSGGYPIALVTTDNFSRNGKKFQDSILTIAQAWLDNGLVPKEFLSYLTDTEKVTFPWTMIDRITPNPSKDVLLRLKKEGFEDLEIINTSKGTNIAPFVNTEEVHYLVIEDNFPNSRPDLSKGGVLLTDRATVDKADGMKVTTCLNPLHTSLAIFGSLLQVDSIADAMKDPVLKELVKRVGYVEGLPVVTDPGVIDPKYFIDEVVNKRFPNPNIPDTPQRIATDTSQKIAIRFGETIKKYLESPEKSSEDLVYIPLVLAGWLRYLLAIDDEGNSFVPSPDPLLEELQESLTDVTLGSTSENINVVLKPILSNEQIFGVDLYKAGLADKVISYFKELNSGIGAVYNTLEKYVNESY